MLNLIKKGESDFLSLPVDVRAKFDHSFEKWLVSFGTKDWLLNMQRLSNNDQYSINNITNQSNTLANQLTKITQSIEEGEKVE